MNFVAHLKYENSVDEIFDVRILPGLRRPGLLNTDKEDHLHALHTPTDYFWAVPHKQQNSYEGNS